MASPQREDSKEVEFPCLRIQQPVGEFYIGVIKSTVLCEITYFDIRRILQEREIETYLGIQRPLNSSRVTELQEYVRTSDACFPTSVILAVPAVCAEFNESKGNLKLSNYLGDEGNPDDEPVWYRNIAKVIDGQHRIEGLREYPGPSFQVNVSIFVEADVAQQAYIFSTVNLSQTKVNKSLVYDLFDLAKSRSPQKLCHEIAVALDDHKASPFYQRIRRLGIATPGREAETLNQATFVQSLIPYMSPNKNAQIRDRDTYKRGGIPARASEKESKRLIFRNMMIDKQDVKITNVVWNYFEAIASKWSKAWNSQVGSGMMLNQTNGFRGFMKFLRPAYLYLAQPGEVPTPKQFLEILDRVGLTDTDFTTENFKPGSSGHSALFRTLMERSGLEDS